METHRFCPRCATKSGEGRFCGQCGKDLLKATSASSSGSLIGSAESDPIGSGQDAFSDIQSRREDGRVGPGQWLVGREVPPGLYRFTGTFSKIDQSGHVISLSVAYSGMGLCRVFPDDYSVDVSGQAIRADVYGPYPVLERKPEGGCYLVSIDLPPGQYRVTKPGGLASWTTFDRAMKILNLRNNQDQVLVTLDPGVFAIEISGTISSV